MISAFCVVYCSLLLLLVSSCLSWGHPLHIKGGKAVVVVVVIIILFYINETKIRYSLLS